MANLRICGFCPYLSSRNTDTELMGEENSDEIVRNSFQESYGRHHGRPDAVGVGRKGKGQICCWRFLKSNLLKLVGCTL